MATFRFFDQAGECAVGIRTYNNIHQFLFFQELVLEAFGHASQYTDDQAGFMFFDRLELREPVPDGLFGLFPDRAGIDEDEVGAFGIRCSAKAIIHQYRGHHFGIGKIHGAAIALYVEVFPELFFAPGKDGIGLTLPGFIVGFIGRQVEHRLIFSDSKYNLNRANRDRMGGYALKTQVNLN